MSAIRSILENDLYKFSMSHYYQKHFPEASGTFTFKDRNNTKYSADFLRELNNELKTLDSLFLQKAEFDWVVSNIPYIPQYFWEWLRGFRFNSSKIKTWLDDDYQLHIEVTDLMYHVTFYEIPILAIVSELYHKHNNDGYNTYPEVIDVMMDKMIENTKIAENHNLFFADFGLRRRFNAITEDVVVEFMSKHCKTFVGTSNVYLARKYNTKAIGSMAHELIMFDAAINGPKNANYRVMENWVNVYDGALGTMLPDTYTVDTFLNNFSMKMAKLYDGVRHDSGDPYIFADKMIAKYKSYGIDPMSKVIIFSDSLDFHTAAKIKEYCAGKIKASFGIGTNLVNPIGAIANNGNIISNCNIVMKLKTCRLDNNHPLYGCVKLSDVPTKAIGNINDINCYKYLLGIN